jgi:hypothetical protein
MITVDDETRKHLHAVLDYLLQDEAEDYWDADVLADDHLYLDVIWLIRQFHFKDLLERDTEIRTAYAVERPRPSTIDHPSSCSPKPKENVMTKNGSEPAVVDSGRRIAKRYAKLEDLESALVLLKAEGEHEKAARLRHEIELLRPYLERGMVKEEAVAAYFRDHPEA